MLKKYKENAKENSYWVNMLDEYFWEGTDMNTGYADIVNSITAKDLQEFTKALLEQNNRIEVSMTSEETNNPIQAYASIYYKTESKTCSQAESCIRQEPLCQVFNLLYGRILGSIPHLYRGHAVLRFEDIFPSMEPYHIMNQGLIYLLILDFCYASCCNRPCRKKSSPICLCQ